MDYEGKKTGGRKKGTCNKVSQVSKELVNNLLTTYQETGKFTKDWESLEPKDRMGVAVKLLQFVLPQMKATSVEVAVDGKQLTLTEKLKQLGKKEEKKEA